MLSTKADGLTFSPDDRHRNNEAGCVPNLLVVLALPGDITRLCREVQESVMVRFELPQWGAEADASRSVAEDAPVANAKPVPKEVCQRAVAAVAAAWESGCPVADWRPEGQVKIANICLRRYVSLARRGVSLADRAGQVRDLARGLVEASGQDRALVGPLTRDYEWLAEQVLAAITGESQDD